MSQYRLSIIMGITSSVISRWCSGRRVPRRETIGKIASALGLSHRDTARLYISAGFTPPWFDGLDYDALINAYVDGLIDTGAVGAGDEIRMDAA